MMEEKQEQTEHKANATKVYHAETDGTTVCVGHNPNGTWSFTIASAKQDVPVLSFNLSNAVFEVMMGLIMTIVEEEK